MNDEEKNLNETEPVESAPAEEPTVAEEAPAPEKEAKKTPKGKEKAAQPSEKDLLKTQLAEEKDKYLRLAAEYDNYRRRSQKERESIYADVRGDTIKKFLPVYDNLVRAAQHEADEEGRKGAEAVLAQFKSILEGFGVTEIEAVGKKFDPTLHNAVLHIDDEKYGEGEIVLELEKGFKLGDKVIRFSLVQVAN